MSEYYEDSYNGRVRAMRGGEAADVALDDSWRDGGRYDDGYGRERGGRRGRRSRRAKRMARDESLARRAEEEAVRPAVRDLDAEVPDSADAAAYSGQASAPLPGGSSERNPQMRVAEGAEIPRPYAGPGGADTEYPHQEQAEEAPWDGAETDPRQGMPAAADVPSKKAADIALEMETPCVSRDVAAAPSAAATVDDEELDAFLKLTKAFGLMQSKLIEGYQEISRMQHELDAKKAEVSGMAMEFSRISKEYAEYTMHVGNYIMPSKKPSE